MTRRDERQLTFDLRPRLKVLRGDGQRRADPMASRDAVARVLLDAGTDLLLRRISVPRAEAIEREVNEVLALFDAVDRTPSLMGQLERRLADLEALVAETEARRMPRSDARSASAARTSGLTPTRGSTRRP